MHGFEEPLEPLERFCAFERNESLASARPGISPSLCDRRDGFGHILHRLDREPSLFQQALVVPDRREEKESDGAARAISSFDS